MTNAANWIPAFKYGHKLYPQNIVDAGVPVEGGNVLFVDGDKSTGGAGKTWEDAFATIQAAVTAASAGDVIYVATKTITALATDPVSYAENIIIPNATSNLSIIGISRGRTQGGLPQIKPGGTTASTALTIRAPGCLIANIGFNGISTAVSPAVINQGIVMDDDGGATSVAFGTSIVGCHFKNCAGSTITNAATGGAINWSSDGGAWQILIAGNRFYKNVGDIVLPGTASSVPQDVVIEDNIFSGPAANVDCNLFLKGGGSGINGVIIRNNIFQQLPAVGSGSIKRYIDATGCTGMLVDNKFGCYTAQAGTDITFGASGTGAYISTTVHMANNYGEFDTGTGAGYISGEIWRT
jgi:hypothetical protein